MNSSSHRCLAEMFVQLDHGLLFAQSIRDRPIEPKPWPGECLSCRWTQSQQSAPSSLKHRDKGIRIFTWPKMIYIFPSAIVALICAVGMWRLHDKIYDPTVVAPVVTTTTTDASGKPVTAPAPMTKLQRFRSPQNLMGVLFLAMLAFNLLVMAPRFPPLRASGRRAFGAFCALFPALGRSLLSARPHEAGSRDL